MAKTLLQTLLTSPGQLKQGAPAGLAQGQRGGVLVSDSQCLQGIKGTDRLQGMVGHLSQCPVLWGGTGSLAHGTPGDPIW